jgi:hypothetical protein
MLLRPANGVGSSRVISRQTMEPGLMRFHKKCVSAAEAGDYYQVSFETEDPGDDATDPPGLDGPYLIIQRQFETPDGGRCYVETHDHGYVGHYRLKLIDFSPTHLTARSRGKATPVSRCPTPWTRSSSTRCSAS